MDIWSVNPTRSLDGLETLRVAWMVWQPAGIEICKPYLPCSILVCIQYKLVVVHLMGCRYLKFYVSMHLILMFKNIGCIKILRAYQWIADPINIADLVDQFLRFNCC